MSDPAAWIVMALISCEESLTRLMSCLFPLTAKHHVKVVTEVGRQPVQRRRGGGGGGGGRSGGFPMNDSRPKSSESGCCFSFFGGGGGGSTWEMLPQGIWAIVVEFCLTGLVSKALFSRCIVLLPAFRTLLECALSLPVFVSYSDASPIMQKTLKMLSSK